MSTTADPPRTTLPVVADGREKGIEYQLFMDCVHCGLCLSACPTYVETGNENDSPRGRIYLMRNVTDAKIDLNEEVNRHIDLCLLCIACESACPSGVQYQAHRGLQIPAQPGPAAGETVMASAANAVSHDPVCRANATGSRSDPSSSTLATRWPR